MPCIRKQARRIRHFARCRTVPEAYRLYKSLEIRTQEQTMKKTSFTPAELNDGFVVAIMLEAKEGEADAVAAIAQKLIGPTMAEPGVKVFIPYRSPTNPSLFFIFELYVEEAAWGAHEKTPHFKAAIKELLPRVVRRERVPFVPFMTI